MKSIREALEQFQAAHGVRATFERAMQFMIAYFALLRGPIPLVASEAFDVARSYWAGILTKEDLEAARIQCWNEIDSRYSSTDFESRNACVIRAVICLLYSELESSDEEVGEAVEWFIMLVNKFEDHTQELERLRDRFLKTL